MSRLRVPDDLKLTHQPSRARPPQPKLPAEFPPMPSRLSPIAKKAWCEVCQILYASGVLTAADGLAVRGLVEAYADRQDARAVLASRGATAYQLPSGIWRAYPEVAMAADADRRMRIWMSALGMSPQDRCKVTVVDRATDGDFSEFTDVH